MPRIRQPKTEDKPTTSEDTSIVVSATEEVSEGASEVSVASAEDEGVSPVFAAKRAGKHGPQAYQLIKAGRLRSWTNAAGKVRVDLAEALAALSTITSHNMSAKAKGEGKTSSTPGTAARKPFKITKEDVLLWETKLKQKAAVVTKVDDSLVTFVDQDGKSHSWSTEGLAKNIASGKVQTADAKSIVTMLNMSMGAY